MSGQKTIWRYKLSETIFNELQYFSKLHNCNDREDFKKAWEEWLKEHSEMVEQEIRRLENMGYNGDIVKKMYTSARYYLKNKTDNNDKEKHKRKTYVALNLTFISIMDSFIEKSKEKPSIGFKSFVKKHEEDHIFKEQIMDLKNVNRYTDQEVFKKMNKTFKNRSYIYNNK